MFGWSRWPGFVRGLVVGVAVAAALPWLVGNSHPDVVFQLPATALAASATDSNGNLAVATGIVNEEEGLFMFNPSTGFLQCWVINKKNPKVAAVFFYDNVHRDIGKPGARDAKYLMVTGVTPFAAGLGMAKPGRSLVYVVNASTGKFAAYAIPLAPHTLDKPGPHPLVLAFAAESAGPIERERE